MLKFARAGLSAIMLLSIFYNIAEAGGRDNVLIIGKGIAEQKLDERITDFHLTITSDTELLMDPSSFAKISVNNGPSIDPDKTDGVGSRKVDFEWVREFKKNDTIAYAFSMIERRKNKFAMQAYFTPRLSPTDVPTLGWEVNQDGDVFLLNSSAMEIEFRNLNFKRGVLEDLMPLDPFEELFDITNSFRIPGIMTQGVVPSAEVDGTPGDILVAKFSLNFGETLMANLSTRFVNPDFSELTTTIILGHEHPLPEPNAIIIVLTALFSLGFPITRLREVISKIGPP